MYIRGDRVYKLWLPYNNIKGTLPGEIGRLTALEYIYLEGNYITALPPEIGSLASPRSLGIRWNKLGALPPKIGQLSNLEYLDLAGNGLHTLPPEVGRLSNLRGLDVWKNRLNVLPVWYGQLSNLRALDFSENYLRAVPAQIGQLSKLERLGIGGNPLSDPMPFFLTNLKNLEVFGFDETGLCLPDEQLVHNWLSGIERVSGDLPAWAAVDYFPYENALQSNFPNPFSLSTQIDFSIAEGGTVKLTVYDMTGRAVATLIDGPMPAGDHAAAFNAYGLSAGPYLYHLRTPTYSMARIMILSK